MILSERRRLARRTAGLAFTISMLCGARLLADSGVGGALIHQGQDVRARCLASMLTDPGRESYRTGSPAPEAPRLEQMALSGLTDMQANVRVVSADQAELARINRDFGMAYRIKDVLMRYKEPNKLRMDGRIGRLIVNGSARLFQVPALHLLKKDDLGDTPGKRYSLMDIGLLTHSALAGMQSKYLRIETLDATETRVFEVSYRGDDSARYVLWIDPVRHIIVKRAWYDSAGNRRATFLYQAAREVTPGMWIPTRIEIRNGNDAVAAVTAYSDLKVNQGLDDSLFDIS